MLNWDKEVTLIGAMFYRTDEYGNQIPEDTSTTVMACYKPISQSEFYVAAQAGIRPATELIVHTFEYGGETEVEYQGERYTVIRVYERDNDETELYLEKKVNQLGKQRD